MRHDTIISEIQKHTQKGANLHHCAIKEEDAAQRYQTRDPWLNIDHQWKSQRGCNIGSRNPPKT